MPTQRKYEVQYTSYSLFYVPDKYNIHDKKIVEDFYIKWNSLRITLTNGETIEIEGEEPTTDMKYPENNNWYEDYETEDEDD